MGILGNVLRGVLNSGSQPGGGEAAALYIELLKKCVGNALYEDDLDLLHGEFTEDAATGKRAVAAPAAADAALKRAGAIWPSRAHTMIGVARLDNLQHCVETVLAEGVPGDLVETGVWRGGAAIFMRGILKAHGVADRAVWCADSFQGLPEADRKKYPRETTIELHRFADLAVSLEQVRENFRRYGLLDGQVRFLEGWFRDTLPAAPIERLAVMRLDGDMYESTMDGLVHLYPKLSAGGFVIVDDYNALQCCNDAVEDYRRQHGISSGLALIPGAGACWRKP